MKIQEDSGTIAPLVAIYLALIMLVLMGSASVGTALIAKNRIQGVSDFAVLYGHDQSSVRGKPVRSELQNYVDRFLTLSQSAKKLELVSRRVWVMEEISNLELCARYRNLFGIGVSSGVICAKSAAKSFLVE